MTRLLHATRNPRTLTVMGRNVSIMLLVALIALIGSVAAFAYWTTSGTGTASGSVSTLNPPTNVAATATVGSGTVAVSWTASVSGSNAVAPQGYYITRTDTSTNATTAACGTSATSLTTTIPCSDTSVPDGSYTYKVVAVYHTWTATSLASTSVSVQNDAVAPTSTIIFPSGGGSYNASGWNAGCLLGAICGAATDNPGGTGVKNVTVTIRQGTGNYWNGFSFGSATPVSITASGTASWSLAFPAANFTDGTYTATATAADNAGNVQSAVTSATFTIDNAAPTVTLAAPSNGAITTNNLPTLSGAAGTASGDQSAITVKIYSGSTTTGTLVRTLTTTAVSGAWSVTPTTALGDGQYTAQASQRDAAGNTGTSTANTFTVDTTAPSGVTTFPANNGSYNTGGWNAGCTTIGFCGSATDATSGIASITLTIKQSSTGNAWDGTIFKPGNRAVTATVSGTSWTYAFSAASFPTDGTYTATGTITDNAGNTFSLPTTSFTIDRIAPTVTLTAPANGSSTNNNKPTFSGAAGTATGDQSAITVKIYTGTGTGGTLLQTLTATASAGSWSVAPTTALAEGTYTTQASQSDTAANTATSGANTFTVDTTAPLVTLTAPANGSYVATTTPTLSGAAGNATGDSTTVTVKIYNGTGTGGSIAQTLTATRSGAAWTTTAVTLGLGTYTAQASQADTAGNTANSSANAFTVDTVDTVAPSVTLTAPANGSFTNISSPNFSGTAGTATGDVATITVKIFAGATATGTPVQTLATTASGSAWSVTPTTPLTPDGSYTAQVLQSDNAGNTGSATSTFTVDTTGPAVTLTAPSAGSTVASATPTFSGAAGTTSGDQSTVTVKIYSGATATGTPVQTLATTAIGASWSTPATSSLSDGTYTTQATQADAAGNTGTSNARTFTINSAAPTITSKPATPSASASPTFGFTHTVYTTFQCSLDGAAFSSCTSPKSYTSLANGSHTFQVKALDSTNAATAIASVTWTIDGTAPTLTATPGNPSANQSPTFSFTSSYTSFECKLDSGSFAACTSPTALSGLSDGSHTFTVHAKDADGSATTDQAYTWTINRAAPTITGKPAATSANTNPTFTFTDTGYTSFECKLDATSFASCTTPKGYSGLAAGSHTFTVHAKSTDGSTTTDQTYTWTINTTGPTITAATTGGTITPGGTYATTTATASFTHPAYNIFQCMIDGGTLTTCTSPKIFTGLADGARTITAYATDSDGVNTALNTFAWTVKTAAPALTGQPANPTNTTTNTFSFNENPYTSFKCKVDNGTLTPCTSPYTTGTLSGTGQTGTTHTFSVQAFDALGNGTTTQTVSWTVDTTASTLGAVNVAKSGNKDQVSGTSNENGGTVTVKIYAGTATTGTPVRTYTTNTFGGSSPSYTWSITTVAGDLTSNSQYTAVATQVDAAGNTSTNAPTKTFTAT